MPDRSAACEEGWCELPLGEVENEGEDWFGLKCELLGLLLVGVDRDGERSPLGVELSGKIGIPIGLSCCRAGACLAPPCGMPPVSGGAVVVMVEAGGGANPVALSWLMIGNPGGETD